MTNPKVIQMPAEQPTYCPYCSWPLPASSGLVDCGGCGSPVSLGIEGRAEINRAARKFRQDPIVFGEREQKRRRRVL